MDLNPVVKWTDPEDEHRLDEVRTKIMLLGHGLYCSFEQNGLKNMFPYNFAIINPNHPNNFRFREPHNHFYTTLTELLDDAIKLTAEGAERYDFS